MLIAATKRIARIEDRWVVPSQSSNAIYAVETIDARPTCTCPDFELRGLACKHIFAVEFVEKRETAPDGTVTETRAVRVTYGQSWAAYNQAQTNEKGEFCRLLHDLCAGIAEPEQATGRPRLPLGDMIFSAAFKVYSTVSGRRFMTDMREACDAGLVAKAPHYNSIFRTLESESLTPIILRLIEESARPLASIETSFAVDSTGFGTCQRWNYCDSKYRKTMTRSDWLKVHAMVGTKTNVVTSVAVTDRDGADAPQFPGLVQSTAERFTVAEVSADKAYSNREALAVVDAIGGTPYIPFKLNARGDGPHKLWNKISLFAMQREEFVAHSHRRSNVEATFSAIKRVFGDSVRSKIRTAQVTGVLLKVLCHNIRYLVHAIHELGVDPMLRSTRAASA